MLQGQRSPDLPIEFERLSETFFSLGQVDSYYESLNSLGERTRDKLLRHIIFFTRRPESGDLKIRP